MSSSFKMLPLASPSNTPSQSNSQSDSNGMAFIPKMACRLVRQFNEKMSSFTGILQRNNQDSSYPPMDDSPDGAGSFNNSHRQHQRRRHRCNSCSTAKHADELDMLVLRPVDWNDGDAGGSYYYDRNFDDGNYSDTY